jgi:hypothetical protein
VKALNETSETVILAAVLGLRFKCEEASARNKKGDDFQVGNRRATPRLVGKRLSRFWDAPLKASE